MTNILIRAASTERFPKPVIIPYRLLRLYKKDLRDIYAEFKSIFNNNNRALLVTFEFEKELQNAPNETLFNQILAANDKISGITFTGYQNGMSNGTMALDLGNTPALITLTLNEKIAILEVINIDNDRAFDGLESNIDKKILSKRQRKFENILYNTGIIPFGTKVVIFEQLDEPKPLNILKWSWTNIEKISALIGLILLALAYFSGFLSYVINIITTKL